MFVKIYITNCIKIKSAKITIINGSTPVCVVPAQRIQKSLNVISFYCRRGEKKYGKRYSVNGGFIWVKKDG